MIWVLLHLTLLHQVNSNLLASEESINYNIQFKNGKQVHGGAQLDVKDRVLQLEEQNSLHKNEIAFLKSSSAKDRKVISNLIGRVVQLEGLIVKDGSEAMNKLALERPKRPVRLLPSVILR